MNKITKKEERFRLMNKLLSDKLGDERIEIDDITLSTYIKLKFSCTAEMSLIVAIAKRTGASFYLGSDGVLVLYAMEITKYGAAHYLRWADQNIKDTIELMKNE